MLSSIFTLTLLILVDYNEDAGAEVDDDEDNKKQRNQVDQTQHSEMTQNLFGHQSDWPEMS